MEDTGEAARNFLDDNYGVGCVLLERMVGLDGYLSMIRCTPDLTGATEEDGTPTATPPVWALFRLLAARSTVEAFELLESACRSSREGCLEQLRQLVEEGAARRGAVLMSTEKADRAFKGLVNAIYTMAYDWTPASQAAVSIFILACQCLFGVAQAGELAGSWRGALEHAMSMVHNKDQGLLAVYPSKPAAWQIAEVCMLCLLACLFAFFG
jgi:hypothetical protein